MEGDPNGGDALVAQWRNVLPDQFIGRASVALDVLHEVEDKPAALSLAQAPPATAPSWPADLPELPALVDTMKAQAITCGPLVEGLSSE